MTSEQEHQPMSLSDRLAMAAAERARAAEAGTSVEDLRRLQSSFRPSPTTNGSTQPAGPARVLIAGSTTVSAIQPDPLADPRSICPTCGRTGELGMVDLPGRTSDWSCPACGTLWRLDLPEAPAS